MTQRHVGPDEPVFDRPLDAADPRYVGEARVELPARRRELVASQGPGSVPANPHARVLRTAVPLVFVAAVLVVGAVFFRALAPGPGAQVVGEEAAVRAAVAERPYRVCRDGRLPCAWLTLVGGRLLALSTSGPVREESGRMGVAPCPTSGYFGSNVTGSRYDQSGTLVSGTATRGLDRFAVRVDHAGRVVVDFTHVTAGRRAGRQRPALPPAGPPCDVIPPDRDADLVLD